MKDEQIERVLIEARLHFMLNETMRPFFAYSRVVSRFLGDMDEEECRAVVIIGKLAMARCEETYRVAMRVLPILCRSIRSDGYARPPAFRTIARRLGVGVSAVDEAIALLTRFGLVHEGEPKGMIFRRRRFRLLVR